jgi:hypothetical protein
MQRAKDTKVLHKVGWLGARIAAFSIIGHQMLNWEWNFTKQSNWDTNIIQHHFVICTVKYTHLCIMHKVQTSEYLNLHRKVWIYACHACAIKGQTTMTSSFEAPYIIEFTVKFGQHGTSSLCLVQSRVRFKKHMQKKVH